MINNRSDEMPIDICELNGHISYVHFFFHGYTLIFVFFCCPGEQLQLGVFVVQEKAHGRTAVVAASQREFK